MGIKGVIHQWLLEPAWPLMNMKHYYGLNEVPGWRWIQIRGKILWGHPMLLFCALQIPGKMVGLLPYLPKCKDESNLRWPPPQKKMHLLRKEKFYYWFCTLNTRSMSDSLYLYQSLLVSPPSLSFHNISSVLSAALDIQHFLKPITVISGNMHCNAVMIHID